MVVDPSDYRPRPAGYVLDGGYLSRNLILSNCASLVFPEQAYYLPLTEYLYRTLEAPLREYTTDRAAYDEAFEEFEILLSLLSMDTDPEGHPESAEPPRGRFAYARNYGEGETTYERLKREATEQGAGWGPIRDGLIEADAETLAVYFRRMDGMIRDRRCRPSHKSARPIAGLRPSPPSVAADPAAGLSAPDPLSPPIYRRLRERPNTLPREIAWEELNCVECVGTITGCGGEATPAPGRRGEEAGLRT